MSPVASEKLSTVATNTLRRPIRSAIHPQKKAPGIAPGLADMRDVLGVMTRSPGDGNQVDTETFVDQEPHDTAMVPTRRRARCDGF